MAQKGNGPNATNVRPAKKTITAPIKKIAGGFETTTATTLRDKVHSIALCARPASIAGVFRAKPCHGIGQSPKSAKARCDTIWPAPAMGPMLENIVIEYGAQTHALKWVSSRPELTGTGLPASHGYGRDGPTRKAGRMAYSMFSTSRPPDALEKADGGFQSQYGAETMTTVNSTTTPKKGTLTLGTTPATSPITLARRLAIETALIAALFHLRTGHTQHCIELATGRATRAASMLKQACAESTTSGRA